VLSGRGLCDELIARPEESYRLCCVVVCDLETSRICTPYIYDIIDLRVNAFIQFISLFIVYYDFCRVRTEDLWDIKMNCIEHNVIQCVLGETVNILEGGSMDYSE
jgi:hypothetical protein